MKIKEINNNLLSQILSNKDYGGSYGENAEIGENFHMKGVSIFSGKNEYETSKIVHLDTDLNTNMSTESLKTPNRPRELGGVVIYLESEHGKNKAVRLFFHKGNVYLTQLDLPNQTKAEFQDGDDERLTPPYLK